MPLIKRAGANLQGPQRRLESAQAARLAKQVIDMKDLLACDLRL
jgi:hypothetical protein